MRTLLLTLQSQNVISHTFTSPKVFLGTTFTRNHNLFACRLTTTLLIDKTSQQYSQTLKLSNKIFKLWEFRKFRYVQDWTLIRLNWIPCAKASQSAFISKTSPKYTQFCKIWSNMKMLSNPAKYEVLIKQYLRSILEIVDHYYQTTFISFKFEIWLLVKCNVTYWGHREHTLLLS